MARILLVEPDIRLGKTFKNYLETTGHQVDWQTQAQAALTSVDAFKPEVILLELQLSTHNGIEFLYELRSYKDWQSQSVIIHSQVPPILKAISPMLWDQLGILNYLYKPTTKLKDLSIAIDTALAKDAPVKV